MTEPLPSRLRFHGRYASETQDACAARKNAEREEAAAYIEGVPPPCELPACEVAQIWLKSESLHYRTVFDDGALTRLTAVIQRARNDGYALGKIAKPVSA